MAKRHFKTSDESGLPRIDLIRFLEQPRVYKAMCPIRKQEIIDKIESDLRMIAWIQNKLNMLIGQDKNSVEPVWNDKKEVL